MDTIGNIVKKDISNYLHLYLGQEGMTIKPYTEEKVRIIEVHQGGFMRVVGKYSPAVMSTNFIKLILRPLSDMKEEEFEEFRTITGYPSHTATFEGAEGTLIKYRYGNKSTVKGFKTSINTKSMRPEMFLYLISRGYDLFSLIQENLAVDKTKL